MSRQSGPDMAIPYPFFKAIVITRTIIALLLVVQLECYKLNVKLPRTVQQETRRGWGEVDTRPPHTRVIKAEHILSILDLQDICLA